ncbi:MAG TPA: Rne/Rng family ribonuclease [Candidatus Binatia bacterium]|nr:Rne/Rng family ribonuclease [Candidatus Binatia bacterium]
MKKQIVLNCTPQETRVAILEGGQLAEIYIERLRSRGVVGNIYKARVQRVLPGMQAAFVDVGFEKAAFLHASDFLHEITELAPLVSSSAITETSGDGEDFRGAETEPNEALEEFSVDSVDVAGEDEGEGEPVSPQGGDTAGEVSAADPRVRRRAKRAPLETKLSRGQEILVQVSKEPIGTKGSRVTSYISLAGRYLVFMPTTNHIGVSRRIAEEQERKRLKDLVISLRPPGGGGFIVRTVCEGLSKREIQADINFLTRQWDRIMRKSESVAAPAVLYYDMDQVQRTVRDLLTPEVGRVWVDSPHEHQRILELVDTLAPRLKGRIALYEEPEPIFAHFGIEAQIDKALERKVWLKSGGYLVIERTEALAVVDVNTGRYVGKKNQDETILRTNLEAAEEVVRQLRLRNIGGLIIIDFIDMEKTGDRQRVYETLQEAVRQKDKAQTKILKISELGLVEMTRKRSRESLEQLLCSPCPHCEGTGSTKSAATVSYEILRKVQHASAFPAESSRVVVKTSSAVAGFLSDSENRVLDQIEKAIGKRIIIKAQEAFRLGQYEIVAQ